MNLLFDFFICFNLSQAQKYFINNEFCIYVLRYISRELIRDPLHPLFFHSKKDQLLKLYLRDFLSGLVVKNLPSIAGDAGSIRGRGTKTPHAAGQQRPCATTTELTRLSERARMLQTTEPTCPGAHVPQLERENPHATTREKPARCNKEPALQRKTPARLNEDPTCLN